MDPDEIKRTHRGRMGRKVMQFYEAQNELIDDLLRPAHYREPGEEQRLVKLKIAVYGTVAVNVLLLGLQLYAAISSGSLSLFATCFDAFLDLACNGVLLYTSWTSKKSNPEKFPVGARRLETAGIIVFSCLMASLSVQLLTEAGRSLAAGFREFDLTPLTIGIIGFAIFIKVVMFCYCWIMRQYPTAKVLAQDNINDVVLNTFGVTLSYLGFRYVWWLDPAGAIIIGLLIMRSWATTAYEQIQLIIGKTAEPSFMQKLTYIALTHDPHRIKEVDTVRAYSSGALYWVEVDIVLPEGMSLKEAHDIGEELQVKLETVEGVERAFVHLDYESSHRPEHFKTL
ncbi:cation efflux protein [Cladochytrium replicatum]|nr:cation efflux protein [Cladochytrium replicatum]